MKMSGADFRAFLDCKDPNIWPRGLYIEEELLRIDGEKTEELPETFAPNAVVEIIAGSTAWESLSDREKDTPALATLARRWMKKQTTANVVVSVPKENLDRLAGAIESIGARVLTK